MKKSTIIFIAVILVIGGYLAYEWQKSDNIFSSFMSPDLGEVQTMTLSFLEDIKFKDFKTAASYHSLKDQKKVNIPVLIERKFKIKPEFLDIMEYKVLEKSLDSTGKRARVKVMTTINVLNTGKIKKPELIFYFHKRSGKWYMELESSLKR